MATTLAKNDPSPLGRPPVIGLVTSKQTRTTQLLTQLRAEIISGRLPPGERLVLSALSEQFEAGQTPIREALLRLASEGLVVLEDQRGFTVAPVSREELIDLTHARAEIDALALRWSIEHGDDHWEATLLASYHRLKKLAKVTPGNLIDREWQERHNVFHSCLVEGCNNKVILQVRATLNERAERYRHLSVRYLRFPRDDQGEHEAILNAALARDAALAEGLLKQHILRTTDILLNELDHPANVAHTAV